MKFIIGLLVLWAAASASATDHVTICHATGSQSNPFVMISPDASGVFNGHIAHQHSEDIIPPFEFEGQIYSQNWPSGQATFNNGCKAPESQPPVEPPVPPVTPPVSPPQPPGEQLRTTVVQTPAFTIKRRKTKKSRPKIRKVRKGCKVLTLRGNKVLRVRRVCRPKPKFTG